MNESFDGNFRLRNVKKPVCNDSGHFILNTSILKRPNIWSFKLLVCFCMNMVAILQIVVKKHGHVIFNHFKDQYDNEHFIFEFISEFRSS